MSAIEGMKVGSVHESGNHGEFEIIGYMDRHRVFVKFINTGYENVVSTSAIRAGSVKDRLLPSVYGVGYIGDGYHKSKYAGKDSAAYSVWLDMIRRCYDVEYQKNIKSCYIGCTVDPEWHNYQNFAKWYYFNLPQDGKKYHIDKDIKIYGNKIYSKDNCILVVAEDNCAHSNAKSWTFRSPDGDLVDIYNLHKFCKENGLDSSSMGKVKRGKYRHHKGWTNP